MRNQPLQSADIIDIKFQIKKELEHFKVVSFLSEMMLLDMISAHTFMSPSYFVCVRYSNRS